MEIKPQQKLSSLSVFFPCFNEEQNIPVLIEQSEKVLPTIAKKYEIIIVNDGSSDKTKQVVQDLAKNNTHLRLVNHQQNLGYGASIRSGIKASQYRWIFFTDGDNQFDLQELKKFSKYTDKFSIILGYRKKRAEGFKRNLFAKLYKLYIDLLFRVHVKDIDCAFKLMKADVIKDLDLFSSGAFISSELLYKLKKKKVEFKQLPVNHYQRLYGKATGSNFKVILIGLWEPLKLYLKLKFNLNL